MSPLPLPQFSGVILLPGTPLFPHGALPLQIFEPRYQDMLAKALEGDCLFCVGSLTDIETSNPADCVAPIGTLALIRASREMPDGRSELVLQGICRVHFRKWITEHSFPCSAIDPFHSIDIPADEIPHYNARLRHSISRTLAALPDETAETINQVLDEAKDSFTIADIVSQQFVTDNVVRRQLLETPEIAGRIEILIDLLDRAKPRSAGD